MTLGRSDSRTVGLCLLVVTAYLSDSPTVRQSVRWRPEERSMITDFSYVRALAASPDWLFAATTHGLVIYDRRRRAWLPPVTVLDGYPQQPVRGAIAEPGGNAVYLALDLGYARYDLITRQWDRVAGAPPPPPGAALSVESALNEAPGPGSQGVPRGQRGSLRHDDERGRGRGAGVHVPPGPPPGGARLHAVARHRARAVRGGQRELSQP